MLTNTLLKDARNRDVRLDFIRGLALYMILFDHVIGDPFRHFTYRVLGYSDAAEIFVFVSGVTCGIVYHRLLKKSGWSALFVTLSKRAIRIYAYFVLSGLAILLLLINSHSKLGGPLPDDIVSATWLLLGLHWTPPFSGMLLFYLPLTLIVLPLFFWGAAHNAIATLCVSVSIWLIVQLFPQLGAAVAELTYLNPLAWQLLFVIGLLIGVQNCGFHEQPWFKRNQWLVTAAWTVVVLNLACRFSIFILPNISPDFEWLRISDQNLFYLKQTLSPIRLSHFLGIALLFSIYIRPNSLIIQSFAGKMFALAGCQSLTLFSLSAVLSTAANILILAKNPSMTVHLVIDCALVATMGLTAIILTARENVVQKVF